MKVSRELHRPAHRCKVKGGHLDESGLRLETPKSRDDCDVRESVNCDKFGQSEVVQANDQEMGKERSRLVRTHMLVFHVVSLDHLQPSDLSPARADGLPP